MAWLPLHSLFGAPSFYGLWLNDSSFIETKVFFFGLCGHLSSSKMKNDDQCIINVHESREIIQVFDRSFFPFSYWLIQGALQKFDKLYVTLISFSKLYTEKV